MHRGYERLRERWYREGWYSGRTLIDALECGADEHGDAELVFAADGAETLVTLAELHRRATAVAAGLQARGIAPGDAVAVQMTNRIECAVVYQAVVLCGAVLVPIVHIYGPAEVECIMSQSEAKLLIAGAATVTEELGRRAHDAGIESFRCYGCTEHPTVTSGRADEAEATRFGTDGAPLPGSAVRILAPDQFIGYCDPALDADAFTADGWFRTGDLGHVDTSGRLTITDRIKDVIIRGGEMVSSGQVEDVLNTHPAVAEGAVVAAPHPTHRYGDVVAAVVVLNPGAALEIDDLRSHFAASGLAKQKTPERLVVVDALPRTAMGKVRKADLRKEHFG